MCLLVRTKRHTAIKYNLHNIHVTRDDVVEYKDKQIVNTFQKPPLLFDVLPSNSINTPTFEGKYVKYNEPTLSTAWVL